MWSPRKNLISLQVEWRNMTKDFWASDHAQLRNVRRPSSVNNVRRCDWVYGTVWDARLVDSGRQWPLSRLCLCTLQSLHFCNGMRLPNLITKIDCVCDSQRSWSFSSVANWTFSVFHFISFQFISRIIITEHFWGAYYWKDNYNYRHLKKQLWSTKNRCVQILTKGRNAAGVRHHRQAATTPWQSEMMFWLSHCTADEAFSLIARQHHTHNSMPC